MCETDLLKTKKTKVFIEENHSIPIKWKHILNSLKSKSVMEK